MSNDIAREAEVFNGPTAPNLGRDPITAKAKVSLEIASYVERGGALDAKVQFDTGLSAELFGQTRITVRDIARALELPLAEKTQ